jgi:hypothetical protein
MRLLLTASFFVVLSVTSVALADPAATPAWRVGDAYVIPMPAEGAQEAASVLSAIERASHRLCRDVSPRRARQTCETDATERAIAATPNQMRLSLRAQRGARQPSDLAAVQAPKS